jgi:hypothetical protein
VPTASAETRVSISVGGVVVAALLSAGRGERGEGRGERGEGRATGTVVKQGISRAQAPSASRTTAAASASPRIVRWAGSRRPSRQ